MDYEVCCKSHALNMALGSIYDDCQDFERRPSWNIVFCENIRLPAFGWRQTEGAPQKVLVLSFLHDETPWAKAVLIEESKECQIDLSEAGFNFCDNYNTYALNQFRDLASWLEAPTPQPTYIATIAATDSSLCITTRHCRGKDHRLCSRSSSILVFCRAQRGGIQSALSWDTSVGLMRNT